VRLGRALAILVGLVLIVVGGISLFSAVSGLLVAGFDNRVDTGTNRVRSETAAIASGAGDLGGGWITDWPTNDDAVLHLRITANARGGKPLFVGVGSAADVRGYLDRVLWDEVDTFSSTPFSGVGDVRYTREGSGAAPTLLVQPTIQPFWANRADGNETIELSWDHTADDQWLVLMNADGSPGVDTDTSIELEVPGLTSTLLTATVFGAFLTLTGIVFLRRIGREFYD
jgi:hypothetical protein